jgi:hypothetical protein
LVLQIYHGWVQHQCCRAHCTAHSNCTGQIAAALLREVLLQHSLNTACVTYNCLQHLAVGCSHGSAVPANK